jgi:uncharacterized protein (TIGR03435 family)
MIPRTFLLFVVPVAFAAALRAQAPASPPAFEVASIKPNKSGSGRVAIGFQPGGRFTATGITVRNLIAMAYGTPQPLPAFQIMGGPDWVDSARFDIIAKAEGDPQPGPNGPLPLMMRTLLADRFKLVLHTETRDLPIYALGKAREDGRLGPQLRPAAVDCAAARGRGGAPPPAGPPGGGGAGRAAGPDPQGSASSTVPVCRVMVGPANIAAGGVSVTQLATLLAGRVNRIVVDRTGLAGSFDIELAWTPDQMPQGRPGGFAPPPGAPPLPPIDPDGPSLFTAVQEQLGLKLESTRGPVEVFVIDSIEPPTED